MCSDSTNVFIIARYGKTKLVSPNPTRDTTTLSKDITSFFFSGLKHTSTSWRYLTDFKELIKLSHISSEAGKIAGIGKSYFLL